MDQQTRGTLTLSQLSEIARRLPQAIAQAARQGIITRSARGEYPIACVTQWVKHLQDRIKAVGAGAGVVKERREYLAEKTKLVRIQRLDAEHAVIAVADVQEMVARIGLRVRNNALQVPSDTTPLLIMQDGSIIFRVLTDRVYRMLEHLSAPETWTDDLEDHEAGDGDKSAA